MLPGKMFIKIKLMGISRAGQWLRLCAPNIGGLGLIPGQRTKILRATRVAPYPPKKPPPSHPSRPPDLDRNMLPS